MSDNITHETNAEIHNFEADTGKLLHLMAHSVYSNREIFLRELISNAADAYEKLRHEAITKPELINENNKPNITITADHDKKQLIITDNGIGMTKNDMISNLGAIARSGTQAFIEKIKTENKKNNKSEKEQKLIGQFGVGFYSTFMVAKKVTVISKHAKENKNTKLWEWSSQGKGQFSMEPVQTDKTPQRGTKITLTLQEDAYEFLEETRLEHITKTWSDNIPLPVNLIIIKEGKETKPRQINSATTPWRKTKSEMNKEQYNAFFQALTGMGEEPLLTIHYHAEGRHEYNALLYIPDTPPLNLYDPARQGRQKLYARGIFITDKADILPPWLRFIRGVIDSEDIPLNLSREMLQDNAIMRAIAKNVTNKVTSELNKIAEKKPDIFNKIWKNYGAVIKEGLYESPDHRENIFKITRFRTTKNPENQNRSLKDYVEAMGEKQSAIYYATGETPEQAQTLPQIEGFRAQNIEVLILSDPVDSFWTAACGTFNQKPLRSITQNLDDIKDLEKTSEKKQQKNAKIGVLVASIKQALGEKISKVRLSERLTQSPVCLVNDTGMDRRLEQILTSETKNAPMSNAPMSKPSLEINAEHPMIINFAEKISKQGVSDETADIAEILLDQAYLIDGRNLADPAAFVRRMNHILEQSLKQENKHITSKENTPSKGNVKKENKENKNQQKKKSK